MLQRLLVLKAWILFAYRIVLSNFNILRAPYKYFFVVTKRCQSRCMYCKIWKIEDHNEMTLDNYRVLAKSINTKLSWLNLTGGEPTDRADLVEVIRLFKQECPNLLFVNFTTNGLRPEHIENVVRQIAALKIPYFVVNVSLDGPEKVNDAIRGVSGSYNLVLDTYSRLRKIRNVKSMLALTLYPNNVDKIEETFQSVHAKLSYFKRSDLHINIAHLSDHAYSNGHQSIPIFDYKEQLLSQIRSFLQKREFEFFNLVGFVEKAYRFHLESFFDTRITPIQCKSLQSSVHISESGEIYPCTIWNKKIDFLNKHNYDINQVLKSEIYQATVKDVQQKKCPSCWTPCEAFHSILGNMIVKR